VLIPARNETEDLEICLQQIIANDYPKLEILVLDDCSQLRRTSEIIRGYAHDGVRFIQGEEPSDTWLPKNQAYNRLAKEASGQYLLFCGVDVRFGPETIRQIMNRMLLQKKEMLSALPWRLDGAGNALTQGLRYWWELVPPRRLFRRPPVLSTCWVISRKLLEDSGGFQAVARSITPEAHFARAAVARDAYSFVRASQASDIASVKGAADQRATMLRTRYPQLHRRPENVIVLTAVQLFFLVLPFVMTLFGYWLGVGWVAQLIALAAAIVLIATYQKLLLATRTGSWTRGLGGLPLATLYDIGMLHYSMWLYEFSTVDWKGRNICIPAMHVVPHLPKID
jgi:chlorobactene glucosyltransferase